MITGQRFEIHNLTNFGTWDSIIMNCEAVMLLSPCPMMYGLVIVCQEKKCKKFNHYPTPEHVIREHAWYEW